MKSNPSNKRDIGMVLAYAYGQWYQIPTDAPIRERRTAEYQVRKAKRLFGDDEGLMLRELCRGTEALQKQGIIPEEVVREAEQTYRMWRSTFGCTEGTREVDNM